MAWASKVRNELGRGKEAKDVSGNRTNVSGEREQVRELRPWSDLIPNKVRDLADLTPNLVANS
jgi:hypothetical protein